MKPYFSTRTIHSLNYYDITFISEGSGFFTVGDQTHIVKPQDVIFTQPGETRNWDNRHILSGQVLVFEEKFVSSIFNDPEFLQHLSFFSVSKYSTRITLGKDMYIQIHAILSNLKAAIKESEDMHIIRALLYEALMLLNRIYISEHNVLPVLPEENKKVKNRYVNDFLNLVNVHYTQHHSIRFYAERLSITPNYLNEILKKSIGMNAKLYIQNRIMQESKRMLIYTDMPVSAIAEALNFENASYFIRFFRNQTQCTPLQFRNRIK
jgi:AraC-like DNA-binding protein